MSENGGDRQRAAHGAELVERFMQPESPAIAAGLLSRVRQHHVARRVADRLADAFEDDQRCGRGPVAVSASAGTDAICTT